MADLVLPLARILGRPEIMNRPGCGGQKCDDRRRSVSRLQAEQNTGAAGHQRDPAGLDRKVRRGNVLCAGVPGELVRLQKMVDAAVEKKSSEERAADQKGQLHRFRLRLTGWTRIHSRAFPEM